MGEAEVTARMDDLCASYQQAVIDALAKKTGAALDRGDYASFGLSGGVSNNRTLRTTLEATARERGVAFHGAQPQHTGDNAGMIAFAAWCDPRAVSATTIWTDHPAWSGAGMKAGTERPRGGLSPTTAWLSRVDAVECRVAAVSTGSTSSRSTSSGSATPQAGSRPERACGEPVEPVEGLVGGPFSQRTCGPATSAALHTIRRSPASVARRGPTACTRRPQEYSRRRLLGRRPSSSRYFATVRRAILMPWTAAGQPDPGRSSGRRGPLLRSDR